MTHDEKYMHRCLELARLAEGKVAPNPMVGAVLVYEDRIIGEGYHQQYGKAHAEPNCIASVSAEDQHLVEQATLYVSLEPCAHFGKTPPCADLVVERKIPKVIIGCRDPFPEVNGKGMDRLKAAGIEVQAGVLEKECMELNKRFFTFHNQHRPYVILKWAQTLDGKIAGDRGPAVGQGTARVFISNEYSNRIVHKWRSQEMSIAVGTHTALSDDPELTTRLWKGNDPLRIVIDRHLRLPRSLKLFNAKAPTLVFNTRKHNLPMEKISLKELREMGVAYYQVTEDVSLVHQMLNALYRMDIQSVLVEGGSYLLQSFIDEESWDEARVITNEQQVMGAGLPAPVLNHQQLVSTETVFSDVIRTYKHTAANS